jgi:hypothetical protein
VRIIICACLLLTMGPVSVQANDEAKEDFELSKEYEKNKELIERMADSVYQRKTSGGVSPWWSCGEKAETPRRSAKEWAYLVVVGSKIAGEKYGFSLNPWAVLGMISRESEFDECALGYGPRLWAYEKGLLKRKRTNISHSRKELDQLLRNKEFRKRWPRLDFGPGQLMWGSVYKGPLNELLSTDPGVFLVTDELGKRFSRHSDIYHRQMKNRPKRYRNKKPWYLNRPWAFWQGDAPSKDYDKGVVRRARSLGATKEELSGVR